MSTKQTESDRFQEIVTEEWEFRVRADPLFATSIGDHRFNDRLPSVGEADYDQRLDRMRGFRQRLISIDRQVLTPSEQLNYDIFGMILADEIGEIEYKAYRMPLSKTGGFHISFPELPQLYQPLDTLTDYENYTARLNAFLRYTLDHIEVMKAGLRDGQVSPGVTLEGVLDQLETQIVDAPEQSWLFKPYEQFPEGISPRDQDRLAEVGRAAILDSIVPGYQALLSYFRDEYYPASRGDISASSLPDGPAYYRHRIRYFTSLDLTPEEIHEIGLSEVGRIQQEMESVISDTGFKGSFKEFIDFLRSEPRFYADTPAGLLKEVAYVLKKIDGELPRLFNTLPRIPYGIRPIPDFSAPASTTAYYYPPPGDRTRAGIYYVNTYDLKSRPLYEIEALSLHEAVPGHHLQIALQMELDELPNFRKFGWITAFGEGWALYAERLGLEMGFYEDPYCNFGRLSYEMWRACRLVVDTGIHALSWTRQQAIDFMAEKTASTLLNITNEVDRYIAWPGQSLAYKIGELKIRELRSRGEQTLGERFDLRQFHDLVLGSGTVPLRVLDTTVKDWIDKVKPTS